MAPSSGADPRLVASIRDLLAARDADIIESKTEGDIVDWMRSFIVLSLATDVIFAPVPGGCAQTRRIVVEFEEPYRAHVKGSEARARRFLGIGHDVVYLDLLRVAEANSFHLDVSADESSYVEQAHVILPRAHGDALARPAQGDDSEYLLVSPLRGDHRAHVYWRDFQTRDDSADQHRHEPSPTTQQDLEGHVLIGSDGLSHVATVETTRADAEAVVDQLNEFGSDAWESFVLRARSA